MKKGIFIITAFLLYCALGGDPALAQGYAPPNVNAQSAILMEQGTGKVLYAKNERQRMYPASITKVLTAIVALEYLDPEEIVTTGTEVNAVPYDSSTAGHLVGESLKVENLIRGLFIPSGNETGCVAAAAVVKKAGYGESMAYGEIERIFSNILNEKARELGAMDTNFVNPHGYHDANHYTTAYDAALFCSAAMENELIRRIAGETEFYGNGAG